MYFLRLFIAYSPNPLQRSNPPSGNTSRVPIPISSNIFEINFKDLEFEKEIGRGDFGVVYAGRFVVILFF